MNYNHTILLVDDSENDLYLMRAAFKKAEFNCPLQEAHDGEEAIAYLDGEGQYRDRAKFPLPAVILLDLNMPMKNGFDVLDWMRVQPRFKRLSVIVLSASERPQDVEQAFDLGAHSYLVKPRTLEDLTAMIRCLRDWLRYNQFPPLNEAARR